MEVGIMSLLSGAMSAVGAIAQAGAASAQAQSQANAANYNAIIAQQNADAALEAGNLNEEAQRRKSAVDMGHLRASIAENGIGLDSGTATDLTQQSDMNAEMDALNIRYGSQQQARAYKAQSALDLMQAQQYSYNASAATTSGYLTAGASALTGYGKYLGYQAATKYPMMTGYG